MHTKVDPITPLSHALIRSVASLPDNLLARVSTAVHVRLADQIEWGAILAELTDGTSDEVCAAIEAALTTQGEGLSLA
jgi:hypothetical protein